MEAVDILAPEVGLARACAAMHLPRGSVYREDARRRHLQAPAPAVAPRPTPPLALDKAERGALLEALNSVRFANCAPATVYATLLDEGIGFMTPEAVHYGLAKAMLVKRAETLNAAFLANPNRFKGNAPQPPNLPVAAWINPPKKEALPGIPSEPSTLN